MNKAIFLDRDGVINIDTGYVSTIKDFIFTDGIFEVCKDFIDNDFKLFVITNQSGIGRNYFTQEDFLSLSEYMIKEFKKRSIIIEKIYFCPHKLEDECTCRKPKPKMILDAKNDYNINLEKSWFIGDKTSDMQCAINAGMSNMILINSKYVESKHKFNTVNNIIEAKEKILKGSQ